MKYCMRCGVLVDENKNRTCPLCNTVILTDDEIDRLPTNNKTLRFESKIKKKPKVNESKTNKLGLTSLIIVLSSFIIMIILLLIDFLIGFNIDWSIIPNLSILLFLSIVSLPLLNWIKRLYTYLTINSLSLIIYFVLLNYVINNQISWSYYVILSIALLWIYLSSVFLTKLKSILLKLTIDFIATAIFVLLISLGYSNNTGFAKLALPINGLVFILTVISYLFIKTYIYNWRVIVITLSINLSILCFGIDFLIHRYMGDGYLLTWSFIVLSVLIPISIFMVYLNNRYQVHLYLKKKFHI